jgi:glycosyltransferase involved in cell wall biosynthesis
MEGFSIIVCTHNPNEFIFKKLLDAIEELDIHLIKHEIIIVDNNSRIPIRDRHFVIDFVNRKGNVEILVEPKPGLTAARVAGINVAQYDWLIFFDDDNEPDTHYLRNAILAVKTNPSVALIGPGRIEVVFTESVSSWLYDVVDLFQERNDEIFKFDNQRHWQLCYPYGTGLVVKKVLADEYRTRVKSGCYTISDRNGKSLSSGGDIQIVWTGIDMGYAAGVFPLISLKHNIEVSKAKLMYLVRQQYGTASSYIPAFNQVFSDNPIKNSRTTNIAILSLVYSIWRIHFFKLSYEKFFLLLSKRLGEVKSSLLGGQFKIPVVLRWFEKIVRYK